MNYDKNTSSDRDVSQHWMFSILKSHRVNTLMELLHRRFKYFYIFYNFFFAVDFLVLLSKTELYDKIMSRLSRIMFSHWTSLCYNIETYTTPTVEIDLTVVIEKS